MRALAFLVIFSLLASSTAEAHHRSWHKLKGDCSADVTQSLLSLIAASPDNSTISFAANACYRIDGTLELFDRTGLTFEGNGSTFRAFTKGAGTRAHWRLVGGSNIVFRNMTIHGSNPKGGVLDESLQWQHGIDLRGSATVEIDQVTVTDVYGDGVYVGQDWRNGARSKGVRMHNSSVIGTGRNGVSVTAAEDSRFETSVFGKVGYITFDVEPNSGSGQGAKNIVFASNQVGTFFLYFFVVTGYNVADHITATANRMVGAPALVSLRSFDTTIRYSNIVVTDNTSDTAATKTTMQFTGIDWLTVTGNRIPMYPTLTMATARESCNVNISGNTLVGGGTEAVITPYAGCP